MINCAPTRLLASMRTVSWQKNTAIRPSIILLAVVICSGCQRILSVAKASKIASSEQQDQALAKFAVEHPNVTGLLVTEVNEGPARDVGLQVGDVITSYGGVKIPDDAVFFAEQEEHQRKHSRNLELIVWRVNKEVKFTVPSGLLGIDTQEYSQTLDLLYLLIGEQRLQQVQGLLDRAMIDGTLTPSQILVAQIAMIPDESTPERLREQDRLLEQLFSTHSARYAHEMAVNVFKKQGRNRAVVACYRRWLEQHSEDVSVRLNLSQTYNRLKMYTEADAAVNYVLDNNLPLSQYGYAVAYESKGTAALGRQQIPAALRYFEKSFSLYPTYFKAASWLLACARAGDVDRFYSTFDLCRKKIPDDIERLQPQFDAVEAFALVSGNQRVRAQQLVSRWKGLKLRGVQDPTYKVHVYWWNYPGGTDVSRTWDDLIGKEKS
jgi:tetratricopeptide (TPR) repeat protein